MTFNDMVNKQRAKNINKNDLSQLKYPLLNKMDELYSVYDAIDDLIPEDSPLNAELDKFYEGLIRLNKAINKMFDENYYD